jgi:hypothetical protein
MIYKHIKENKMKNKEQLFEELYRNMLKRNKIGFFKEKYLLCLALFKRNITKYIKK